MCGICGLVEYSRTEQISQELVHRMSETLHHRGPDAEGIHVGPGVGLGHRRLSIIDVAGGHQPISNEDGTVWVLLNGEIYNYLELRQELIARGHRFTTNSDTEAIVHLYEDCGEACIARLDGMFSIALWDSRQRKLLLARDRVGKKPLFYAANDKRILFASELKALLAAELSLRSLDRYALSDYFSLGYIPAPKTIYRDVRKLLPGHYLIASASGSREIKYWDISFKEVQHRTEEEWCELIRYELCRATRARLMSEVPLGAFLSGGIDSSAIVATMQAIMSRPVTTCSIGFKEEEYNEADYAREVADRFRTNHREQIVHPEAVDVVKKLAWHYDEPFADSSSIPTYYVSKMARQYVTVALGGDGGDESFAGYRRYYFDQFENNLRAFLPAAFRHAVFGPLGRSYPALAWAPRPLRAKATLQSLARTPLEGYFNSMSIIRPDEKKHLFTADFSSSVADYDTLDVFRHYYDRADTDDLLSRIQYLDIKTYLPDDILAKVDRASMAVSLEVRAPLLDHHLMSLTAAMPSFLKLRGREGKYIFKKALAGVLPDEILYRNKQGFAVPLKRWFRRELKDMAYEKLFTYEDGVLNGKFLRKMWEQHQSGRYDRSPCLWAVLMFRQWSDTFRA
jgi:asparagine synthase (glutamine-hydrolysing)